MGLNINKSDYIKRLYHILVERTRDPSIGWQDITDLRKTYGNIQENKDTTRKGSKLWYEFYEAGWIHEPNKRFNEEVTAELPKHSTTLNSDNSEISDSDFYIEDENKLRDKDYLLRLHGYDPKYFELISAKNSRWSGMSKDGKTMYSSKVTVKPKPPTFDYHYAEDIFSKLDRNIPKDNIEKYATSNPDSQKLLVLPISDLHFNLLSSIKETGEKYDCSIAERLYFNIIADVLARTKQYSFEKIIFTIGGDMSNSDNLTGTTTKGTPQNNEFDYFTMYEKLTGIVIKAIEILADIAPVEVILINGNHDKTTGYTLANLCKAWFRKDPRVTVDTSLLPYKFSVFGKTLFCFAHDGDVKRLPELIPDLAREYWSSIDTTEVFLQHLHSEMVLKEENNMRIQRLPTISARSAWTTNKGYNSKRQCKSFVYDKEYGLTDVLYTTYKTLIKDE